MKILVIEDDEKTASFIIKGLSQAGYLADHAVNGENGLFMAQTVSYDAAVVDIMLPMLDGISLVKRLRADKNMTPVIFLSAKGSTEDRIKGLQAGGDDYLPKPFAFSELTARLQAILRRASTTLEPTTLTASDLTLDLIKRKVYRSGVEIELQTKEFALLEYLIRNKGRVISKTMIIENVWNYSFDPQTNVVEARICHLRDKIDRDFEHKLIQTIRGAGYIIE
jgi:two-component system, OmpR family, response regulator